MILQIQQRKSRQIQQKILDLNLSLGCLIIAEDLLCKEKLQEV